MATQNTPLPFPSPSGQSDVPCRLLGGLSPQEFLSRYWQKQPLLIRQAIPGFQGVTDQTTLFDMGCDPDIESRFVRKTTSGWEVQHGPLSPKRFKSRKEPWTLLIQGLNLWLDDADALLHRFNFIPQARLDDLMVSYATDGGGVGPHFDRYDVFLLQGCGRRRWRIGAQSDRTLVADAPLRILRHFTPEQEWLLEPGDMLYLPPHWAHDGVAVGECTTYSIGFRAPSAQELGEAFLQHLAENVHLDGQYADPDLQAPANTALIDESMVEQVARMLARIRWDTDDVRRFLAQYLSEPKPQVFFDPPDSGTDDPRTFAKQVARHGLRLDARSILLMAQDDFYLNGERLPVLTGEARTVLARLADERRLSPDTLPEALVALLHDAWQAGFVHVGGGSNEHAL